MSDTSLPIVLAVDDEQSSLNAINRILRREFSIILSLNGHSALEVLKTQKVAVILADQRMPGMNGVEFFRESQQLQPDAARVLITGYADIDATIEAINQAQIFYYISKPWEPEDLRLVIRRAAERYQLTRENRRLMAELKDANERLRVENIILHREAEKHYEFENIIGKSKAMQEVFSLMRKVIPTGTTVLLLGATGTGKELIARAIHYNGPRKGKLFVAQNCAALPDTLLESELFGHVKGAFTGAAGDKKGLFELADGGTIFLDEIADTSPALQQRLLRVLQEGEIRPVGSEKSRQVDVRVISATNRDVEKAVRQGEFREDLYYRLNVFPIRIPALRERTEDIPLLAEHFLKKYRQELEKNVPGFDREAMKILMAAPYPGNVRELENEIERAVALAEPGQQITQELLSHKTASQRSAIPTAAKNAGTLKEITESIEKQYIIDMLRETHGNISRTARELGLSRVGLQKKIKRYEIDTRQF